MMNELLVQIAKGLVSDPDAVNVTVDDIDEDGVIVYHLHVAADDMGRVMRSAANRNDQKISVEID